MRRSNTDRRHVGRFVRKLRRIGFPVEDLGEPLDLFARDCVKLIKGWGWVTLHSGGQIWVVGVEGWRG